MKLSAQVLQQIEDPLHHVWTVIASDIYKCSSYLHQRVTNTNAIEACIDANRLFAHHAANAQADVVLQQLIAANGRDAVVNCLRKHIKLA